MTNIQKQMVNRPFEVRMSDIDVVLIMNKCQDVDRVPRSTKLQMQADLTNQYALRSYFVMAKIVKSLVRN